MKLFMIAALLSVTGTVTAINPQPKPNAQPSALAPKKFEPFFENEIIHKLDCAKIGTATYGIDGPTIHDMLWLIDRMNAIVIGDKKETGIIHKKYTFEGEPCTLHDLFIIEKSLQDKAMAEKRAALLKTCRGETALFKQRWEEIEQARVRRQELVTKTLEIIRKDFEKTVTPFMMQVGIFKGLICDLIKEWTDRTHREGSFLLTWHQADHDVFKLFHNEMTSAHKMLQFLADLKDFLTKLIHSCPRAWKDFFEHQEQFATHKNHVVDEPISTRINLTNPLEPTKK